MAKYKIFLVISLAITIVTLITEIAFIFAGNGFGAALCLVFGLPGSAVFRVLAELEEE